MKDLRKDKKKSTKSKRHFTDPEKNFLLEIEKRNKKGNKHKVKNGVESPS